MINIDIRWMYPFLTDQHFFNNFVLSNNIFKPFLFVRLAKIIKLCYINEFKIVYLYMYAYFEDSYRRKCREKLANYFYQIINGSTGEHNHIWAFVIKSIHFSSVLFFLLIYLFAPLWMCISGTVMFAGIICSFIYLKGCLLSTIEYKLNTVKFVNIVDPYLLLCGYPINNDTRYIISQYILSLQFIVLLAILYFRFK
jgi:hypothetical protein